VIVFLFGILFLINFTTAKNVAYIYEKDFKIDFNILGEFISMGMNVDLIKSSQITGTDFSNYDLIFVGDERFANPMQIPVDDVPSVIINHYHGVEFGLLDGGRISRLIANQPLKVDNGAIDVYTSSCFKQGGVGLSYYYLSNRHKSADMMNVAKTSVGYHTRLGDVIAYSSEEDKCFFGIVESDFWTLAASQMFYDCVDFAIGNIPEEPECIEDSDCADGEICIKGVCEVEEIEGGVHDVMLDDLKITDMNGTLIEGEVPVLFMNESYKILIDVWNLGNYTEDVSFDGEIKLNDEVVDTFSHVSVSDLGPGEERDDKKRKIDFDFEPGYYIISIDAVVAVDDFPANNEVMMVVQVV